MRATFIAPGTEQKHPTWCVDPADLPKQRGYSHFHWLGSPAHAVSPDEKDPRKIAQAVQDREAGDRMTARLTMTLQRSQSV